MANGGQEGLKMDHLPEHWLTPGEQREAVREFLEFGLFRFDPAGNIPLTGGGRTDLYLDMRLARNSASAARYVANLYRKALHMLQGKKGYKFERFAEIPHALSGIAGILMDYSEIPYSTIREKPKTEKRPDSHVIPTNFTFGQPIVIIDDVITDGKSKTNALRMCYEEKVNVVAIVVMIDRDDGWRDYFRTIGVPIPVWSAMTLKEARQIITEYTVVS